MLSEVNAFRTEGILKDLDFRAHFDSNRRYLHNSNSEIINEIWARVFNRLTGESLKDCVHLEVHNEDSFLCRLNKIYRTRSNYSSFIIDTDISRAFGVNIDGPIVILKDGPGLSITELGFHELGHRVFRRSKDKYANEFGAYYFQFLAREKLGRELRAIGLKLCPANIGVLAKQFCQSSQCRPMMDAAISVHSMGAHYLTIGS
jgi:hypothetical protein